MNRTTLAVVLTLVIGVLIGLLVARPLASQAQDAVGGVYITAGPGGVWVVRGNQLYTCAQPLIRTARSTNDPPDSPLCSRPTTLPRPPR